MIRSWQIAGALRHPEKKKAVRGTPDGLYLVCAGHHPARLSTSLGERQTDEDRCSLYSG